MERLAGLLGRQVQLLEDATQDAAAARRWGTATGEQLDAWGARAGEARPQGLSDADYARRIEGRQMINRSSGTLDELLELLAHDAQPTGPVEAREVALGVCFFWEGPAPDFAPGVLHRRVQEAAGLSTKVCALVPYQSNSFRLDDESRGLDSAPLTKAI